MKILIVTPELPWPPETGGKASQFATLKALADDHVFRIVVTRASPLLHDLACALERELPHVTVMRHKPEGNQANQGVVSPKKWLQRGKTLLRFILQRRPAGSSLDKQQRVVPDRPYYPFVPLSSESLCFIEGQLGWAELIQAEFHESLYTAFLPVSHIPKIFICHQAHGRFSRRFYESTQIEGRSANDAHAHNCQSLLAATDTAAACALEALFMSHFTQIITFTEEDKISLHGQDVSLPITVSPFPIPADCMIVPPADVACWNLQLFYVGSGLWYPNVQAVEWFCTHVYPLLREQLPVEACILHVIGHWTEELRQPFSQEVVSFRGYAENISAALSGNISINPVFTGAGLRTKLLASAACTSPIVTTSIGCEGVGLRHGHNCFVSDTAEDFAAAILTLMRNQPMASLLATRAFEHALHRFGPEAVRQQRNRIYEHVSHQFSSDS